MDQFIILLSFISSGWDLSRAVVKDVCNSPLSVIFLNYVLKKKSFKKQEIIQVGGNREKLSFKKQINS